MNNTLINTSLSFKDFFNYDLPVRFHSYGFQVREIFNYLVEKKLFAVRFSNTSDMIFSKSIGGK